MEEYNTLLDSLEGNKPGSMSTFVEVSRIRKNEDGVEVEVEEARRKFKEYHNLKQYENILSHCTFYYITQEFPNIFGYRRL